MDPSAGGEVLARPAKRLAAEIGLPTVAPLVEHEWMRVDPAAAPVPEHEARRPLVLAGRELRERRTNTLDVLHSHGEVEVVVLPRLLLEQRIDAPPALEAEPHAGRVQPVEDLRRVAGAHRHR